MAANVGQLSTDELREIIGSVVEEKLKEILGDPDEGLELNANIRERLRQQQQAVAEGERLQLARIIGVARHVVRADGKAELRVAQDPHDLEEIHLAFVWIDLLKLAQAAPDVAHVDLVDLSLLAQVLHDRQDLRVRIFEALAGGAEA